MALNKYEKIIEKRQFVSHQKNLSWEKSVRVSTEGCLGGGYPRKDDGVWALPLSRLCLLPEGEPPGDRRKPRSWLSPEKPWRAVKSTSRKTEDAKMGQRATKQLVIVSTYVRGKPDALRSMTFLCVLWFAFLQTYTTNCGWNILLLYSPKFHIKKCL